MVALQRRVADRAIFRDAGEPSPDAVRLDSAIDRDADTDGSPADDGPPLVVGIDQAFRDEQAVSAAVVLQGDRIVATSTGRAPLSVPYIPGLLAFREAPAIIAALEELDLAPDLLVLDGSGRIHYRQAGIATHVGVLFDCPAIGVAKRLLCGTPRRSLADPLPSGTRIPIDADQRVEARSGVERDREWPTIGYAYQSRQFDRPERRHVNPIYVSPGHRVSSARAVELIAALAPRYKLPEPTRLADARVDSIVRSDPED